MQAHNFQIYGNNWRIVNLFVGPFEMMICPTKGGKYI